MSLQPLVERLHTAKMGGDKPKREKKKPKKKGKK